VPFTSTFYFIDFKAQGQTFENLLIELFWQPPNNVHLNMHNIYITLSDLQSIDGLIILQNIIMQDINKTNFKKRIDINVGTYFKT
jgi:hypothetical protein